MAETTSIYLRDSTAKSLAERGSNRSMVVNRDLDRYYALLDRAIKTVDLTLKEAYLIVDCLNGVLMDTLAPHLWVEIQDAIQIDHVDQKWEVDGPALVAKLRALSETQATAIVDATERYWEDPHTENRLKKLFCIQ